MPNFKKYDYSQSAMVVIDFEEQLQPGTFEFTLHKLIDNHIDLSAFHEKYKNDAGGRSAYDPSILLKIILYAYAKGITSSREIQWQCEHNIIFKALSCDCVPHFTSIASFVSSYPDAIESVFEQVLLVCDQQGLLGNDLFAIDGCKMPSNAAKEHKKLDGRKPSERDRKHQLKQASDTLGKAFDRIDQFLKTATPRMGKGKRPKEVKSNITDNESAKMTTSKGTIQGYNGLATVDKKHQIIVDAQAFGEGQEHHTLKPILQSIKDRFSRLGLSDDIYEEGAVVTADTGFSNEANNRYLKEKRIKAYIPDNQFRSRDPKFNDQKTKYGHRHPGKGVDKPVIPASEFNFDPVKKTCTCPQGNPMWLHSEQVQSSGNRLIAFEGRLTDCRNCPLR